MDSNKTSASDRHSKLCFVEGGSVVHFANGAASSYNVSRSAGSCLPPRWVVTESKKRCLSHHDCERRDDDATGTIQLDDTYGDDGGDGDGCSWSRDSISLCLPGPSAAGSVSAPQRPCSVLERSGEPAVDFEGPKRLAKVRRERWSSSWVQQKT
eukprot:754045-Hanusia_phi.AAC.3